MWSFPPRRRTPRLGPNSDPTYQALRNLTLGGEAVSVSNLDLKREAGTFHLRSGTVCFVAPVEGKVTGAVFVGDGNFVITPPPSEAGMLKLLTKENEFSENFSHLVLRFTDSTYDEIKKAGRAASGGCDSGLLKDSQNAMRHGQELKYNLDARILQDVLSPEPGGLFVAFVHGKRYNDKELFAVDPHGPGYLMRRRSRVNDLRRESSTVCGQHFPCQADTDEGPVATSILSISSSTPRSKKMPNLTGKATTTFVARVNGLRVIPFDLFHDVARAERHRGWPGPCIHSGRQE